MKLIDLNKEVDLGKASRGVFIATFAVFIFTSILTTLIATTGDFGDSVATNAYNKNMAKRNTLAQLVTSTATSTPKPVTTAPSNASTPAPSVDLKVTPNRALNDTYTATWSSVNAKNCVLTIDDKNGSSVYHWSGAVATSGNKGPYTKESNFTITCETPALAKITKTVHAPAPTITIAARAEPSNVVKGGFTNIIWKAVSTGDPVVGCMVYEGGKNLGNSSPENKIKVTPINNPTYYIVICSSKSESVSKGVSVTMNQTPPTPVVTATINSSKNPVEFNGDTEISWSSTNASSCKVSKDDGTVLSPSATSGKTSVKKLQKTSIFMISCGGGSKTISNNITVTVKPSTLVTKPTAKLFVSAPEINSGGSVKINWSSTNADKCMLMKGTSAISLMTTGEINSGSLTDSTVYWITCSNKAGSYTAAVPVQVK